jgi:hypothetical protein
MSNDMIILTRTFDVLPRAEKFPKVYCHTVNQRVMDAAFARLRVTPSEFLASHPCKDGFTDVNDYISRL